MKKGKWAVTLLVLVLALGLAAGLAACGGNEPGTTATTATTGTTGTGPGVTEATAPEATAPAVEDTGQTWELKFSYGIPSAASLSVGAILPWCKAVTEATDGRVTFKHYAEGTLCKDEQQYDFLVSGASDLSVVEPEYTTGVFPVFEMGSLPRLFPDPAVAAAVMWDVAQQYSDEMSEVKVLAVTCIAGAQYIGNKPVAVPADLSGVKMRSGGKIESWILEQLGAEPIDISLGDLGTSLERKVADGAFLSWSLTFTSGAVRFTTNRTTLDLLYRPWLLLINKDVWESMPANIQDAIMSVSGQVPSSIYAIANEMITNESKEQLIKIDQKQGNPGIYDPTPEELAQWTDALMPVWDKWAAELDSSNSAYAGKSQEIMDFVTAKIAEYSGYYEQYKADAQAILDARFE
jgi:TRAP-type C4-dicarboxylate transport system substrate-binding protein